MQHRIFRPGKATFSSALCLLAVLLMSIPAVAQLTSAATEFDGDYRSRAIPLGNNRAAVAYYSQRMFNVMCFDSTAAKVWNISVPSGYPTAYTGSANGKDFYVFLADKTKNTGGAQKFRVVHVDVATGKMESKEYLQEDFGFPLSVYAGKDYFFVYSTKYEFDNNSLEKEADVKLFRFDRQSLEMKMLSHEMGNPVDRQFWQFIRVGDDFVEGYLVKEATQHVSVELARFDNEGKKIKTTEISFDLKNTWSRQTNSEMPLAQGIGRCKFSQNAYDYTTGTSDNRVTRYKLIEHMSSCYLVYSPENDAYFAYGICGPDEQEKMGTRYTGFYVAKMDGNFKLVSFKEHDKVAELTGNKNFNLHAPPYSHYIEAALAPGGNLILFISSENSFRYLVSGSDLSINGKKIDGIYFTMNNRVSTPEKNLFKHTEVTGASKNTNSSWYIGTLNWQYVLVIPHNGGKITVFTDKMD